MSISPKEILGNTKDSIASIPLAPHLRLPEWLKKLTNGSITHKQFILILSFCWSCFGTRCQSTQMVRAFRRAFAHAQFQRR